LRIYIAGLLIYAIAIFLLLIVRFLITHLIFAKKGSHTFYNK
jgi:hypothetical protein